MSIVCRCTGCQARFKVDDKHAGKRARCPKCQTIVEVPLESQPTQANLAGSATISPSGALAPRSAPAANLPPVRAGLPQVAAAPATPAPPAAALAPAAAPISAPISAPAQVSAPQIAPDFGGFAVNTSATSSPAAKSDPGAHRPARKKPNPLPLILAGCSGLMLVLGGIIVALVASGGGGSTPVANKSAAATTSGSGATLVVAWDSSARNSSKLTIDGKAMPLPASGPIEYSLTSGLHSILLQRRGFEMIDESLALSTGERRTYVPAWKQPTAIAASSVRPSFTPAPARPTPASSGGGTAFAIGNGIDESVPGFTGWVQDVSAAQDRAAREQKDLLLVFGSSDASKSTRDLAQRLSMSDVQTLVGGKFVPVVIDFPRGREGYSRVFDHAQNKALAEQYHIQEIPVIVLADARGKPYAIERDWEDGFGNVGSLLEKRQADRAERDSLLAGATAGDDNLRLDAAAKVVQWLTDRKLLTPYEPEISQWMSVAERVDPNNAAGRLEPFFEAHWMLNLLDIDEDDRFEMDAAVKAMTPWVAARKFVDPDRGARLHLIASRLLMRMDKQDDALVHIERATIYTPADKDLREAVAEAKLAVQNKDVLSSGTGFVISPAGYILTNHHVIEGEGKVVVRLPKSKETIPAEVIAQDADRDMALLKVTFPADLKMGAVPVAAVEAGRGAPVAAFGFPLGDAIGSGLKLTTGVVSALPDESESAMILLDLRVNPGNSGGPLCDKHGNVIGMITAKTGGFGVDSYGMAIPAVDLIAFLDAKLPASAERASEIAAPAAQEWNEVDQLVSPSVLMILKTK
jgi:S1-C subfamily serine protease